eukprot:SAG22_NODE_22176_length_251_cov_0.565789_1_plen_58_part_01
MLARWLQDNTQLSDGHGGGGYAEPPPPYEYAIIASALRMFQPGFSPYYSQFCEMHKHA